jgi:hypothetical protein
MNNYLTIFLISLIFLKAGDENKSDYNKNYKRLVSRSFYKNLNIKIDYNFDSIANVNKDFMEQPKYLFPAVKFEYAVLFNFKNKNVGTPWATDIIDFKGKIDNNIFYPPIILHDKEIYSLLRVINDTTSYYHGLFDAVPMRESFCAVIFFNHRLEVVSYFTNFKSCLSFCPKTPNTQGVFISIQKLNDVIYRIFYERRNCR